METGNPTEGVQVMNKLKVLTQAIGTLTVIAILAVGFTALMPAPAYAQCFCSLPVYSEEGWAGGSTCAAAEIACSIDARANAEAFCDYQEATEVCAVVSFSYRNHCPESSSPFTTDCDLEFRCDACTF